MSRTRLFNDIAFFATETPEPGQHYAAFPIAGLTIFVRAAETESLDTAEALRLPHETLLNTYEDTREEAE